MASAELQVRARVEAQEALERQQKEERRAAGEQGEGSSLEEAEHWSFEQWEREQTARERAHQQRLEATFQRVLKAVEGISGGETLTTLPAEIQLALQDRQRAEEERERSKKRAEELRRMREEEEELRQQREQLRRRHDEDSPDAVGENPLQSVPEFNRASDYRQSSSTFRSVPVNLALDPMLEAVLDELEREQDGMEQKEGESELGWLIKYLDEQAARRENNPETQLPVSENGHSEVEESKEESKDTPADEQSDEAFGSQSEDLATTEKMRASLRQPFLVEDMSNATSQRTSAQTSFSEMSDIDTRDTALPAPPQPTVQPPNVLNIPAPPKKGRAAGFPSKKVLPVIQAEESGDESGNSSDDDYMMSRKEAKKMKRLAEDVSGITGGSLKPVSPILPTPVGNRLEVVDGKVVAKEDDTKEAEDPVFKPEAKPDEPEDHEEFERSQPALSESNADQTETETDKPEDQDEEERDRYTFPKPAPSEIKNNQARTNTELNWNKGSGFEDDRYGFPQPTKGDSDSEMTAEKQVFEPKESAMSRVQHVEEEMDSHSAKLDVSEGPSKISSECERYAFPQPLPSDEHLEEKETDPGSSYSKLQTLGSSPTGGYGFPIEDSADRVTKPSAGHELTPNTALNKARKKYEQKQKQLAEHTSSSQDAMPTPLSIVSAEQALQNRKIGAHLGSWNMPGPYAEKTSPASYFKTSKMSPEERKQKGLQLKQEVEEARLSYEKKKKALEEKLAKEAEEKRAAAVKAEVARRLAIPRGQTSNPMLMQSKSEDAVASPSSPGLETKPSLSEAEKEQKRRKQIEASIMSNKVGETLFDASISFMSLLRQLPPMLWARIFSYPSLYPAHLVDTTGHAIGYGVGDPGSYAVFVVKETTIGPSGLAQLVAWLYTAKTPFRIVAMTLTVLSPPVECPSLLPPPAGDFSAERVLLVGVKSVATGALTEELLGDWLARTPLKEVFRTLPAGLNEASALKEVVHLVHAVNHASLASAPKKRASNEEGTENTESDPLVDPQNPLHLFARLPNFHTFGDQRRGESTKNAQLLSNGRGIETVACVVKPYLVEGKNRRLLAAVLSAASETNGLYLAGFRLVYLGAEEWRQAQEVCDMLDKLEGPEEGEFCSLLVLAIRGYDAHSKWTDIVGPEDPNLARLTDPNSLRAKYGDGRDRNLVAMPSRNAQRAIREVIFWFGGRVLPVIPVDLRSQPRPRPCFYLCTHSSHTTALALLPGVSSKWYSKILQECLARGMSLRNAGLVKSSSLPKFCTAQLEEKQNDESRNDRAFICIFQGENSRAVLLSLNERIANVGNEDLTNHIWIATNQNEAVEMEGFLRCSLGELPTPEQVRGAFHHRSTAFASPPDPDLEETSVVVITPDAFATDAPCAALILDALLGADDSKPPNLYEMLPSPGTRRSSQKWDGKSLGLELIGCRFMPSLTESQAQAIVDACLSHSSQEIKDETCAVVVEGPVLLCAVRAVNAHAVIKAALGPDDYFASRLEAPNSLRARFGSDNVHCSVIAAYWSRAFLLLSHFFKADTLLADPSFEDCSRVFLPKPSLHQLAHPLLQFFPSQVPALLNAAIFTSHILQRFALAKVFKKLERRGFELVAIRMCILSEDQVETLAPLVCSRKDEVVSVEEWLQEGPCVLVAFRGLNAIKQWTSDMGPLDLQIARKDFSVSLRANFGNTKTKNPVLFGCRRYADVQKFIQVAFADIPFDQLQNAMGIFDDGDSSNRKRYTETYLDNLIDQDGSRQYQKDGQFTLKETTFVMVTVPLLKSIMPSEIIETLQKQGMSVVQMRLAHLTATQANVYLALHRLAKNKPASHHIMGGPVLLLALESDSAIARVQSVLSSSRTTFQDSNMSRLSLGLTMSSFQRQQSSKLSPFTISVPGELYGKQGAFASETSEMASKELAFFFNDLFGIHTIAQKCKRASIECENKTLKKENLSPFPHNAQQVAQSLSLEFQGISSNENEETVSSQSEQNKLNNERIQPDQIITSPRSQEMQDFPSSKSRGASEGVLEVKGIF